MSFVVSVFLSMSVFLASWTVGTHVVTFTGLEFSALYVVFLISLLLGTLALRSRAKVERIFTAEAGLVPNVALDLRALLATGWGHFAVLSVLLLLLVVGFGALYLKTLFLPLWAACLIAGGYALWRARAPDAPSLLRFQTQEPTDIDMPPTGFLLIFGLLLALYFLTSIPDTDDALFLNMAVAAKTDPGPVMGFDSMLGLPELELLRSTYRLEAFVLLAALFAALSGTSVIVAAHAVVPALICLFAASVLTVMYYTLFRRAWFVVALFHIALLLAMDGSLLSYGYHGLLRFFQGKGMFVTILMPLIFFLTVQYLRTRHGMTLALLTLSVITSIGATANALYVTPLAIALVGAPFLLVGSKTERLASLALVVPVLYPGAFAVYLVLFDPPVPSEFTTAEPIGAMLWGLLATKYMLALGVGLLWLGAASALFNRKMALISLYTIVLLLVVLNPAVWDLYGRYVTGYINVRLMWAVPVPFILAILAGMIWQNTPRPLNLGVPLVLILALVAPGSILQEARFGPAMTKVHQPAYGLAEDITTQTPEAALILAPEDISAWLATFDIDRPIVEGRWLYIPQRKAILPAEEHAARNQLYLWTDGKSDLDLPMSEAMRLMDQIGVSVVVTRAGSQAQATMQAEAAAHGFNRFLDRDGFMAFQRAWP